jgi:septal ring-binding cell division protein DamX
MKLRYFLAVVVWWWAIPGLPADLHSSLQVGLEAYRLGQFRRAYTLLEPLAGKGEVQAQFTLAMMYSSGKGVKLDEYRAAHWFGLAAAQGHRDSEYFLAQLYEQGWGIEHSPEKALQWYERCAEQSDSRCQRHLKLISGQDQDSPKKPMVVDPPAVDLPAVVVTTAEPPSPLPSPTLSVDAGAQTDEPASIAAALDSASEPPPAAPQEVSPPAASPVSDSKPESTEPVKPVKPMESVESSPNKPVESESAELESEPAEPVQAAQVAQVAQVASAGEILSEDWVLAQNQDYYTLQVLTSPNEQIIRDYVHRHDLKGDWAIVPELRRGQTWYNLLYGSYETGGAAIRARALLPPEVTKAGPWARRFRSLRMPPHTEE